MVRISFYMPVYACGPGMKGYGNKGRRGKE